MSTSRRNSPRKAVASSFPICAALARRAFAIRRRLRSGEQAAIGADVIALMDALGIKRAVLAGHNWGGRAACVAAALWPERCAGLVTVNSYLIQDLSRAMVPIGPQYEAALWYEYYFQIERGRAGLAANRREIARILWEQWSPDWDFDDATFDRTARAHDNPDYVDVVIHSYRHRFGLADGDDRYAGIAAPAGVAAADRGAGGDAGRRCGRRCSPPATAAPAPRNSPAAAFIAWCRGAGHNLPQEAPEAFAAAVMELVKA